jgi:hypothetical protein
LAEVSTWFIDRAFRLTFRVAPHAIAYARRIGLASALPALPCWLPDPDLSETVKLLAPQVAQCRAEAPLALLRALHDLMGRAAGTPRMRRATGTPRMRRATG